ncbi:MAG: hypothetical protein N7Q72_04440, partial [Spiroplasma sp. Tabriz.8]|nr:hypothetical protein [Spiroplasma sp. Tabriz.8]
SLDYNILLTLKLDFATPNIIWPKSNLFLTKTYQIVMYNNNNNNNNNNNSLTFSHRIPWWSKYDLVLKKNPPENFSP